MANDAQHNAQAQIIGYANDLLQLYAERAVQGGFRYPPDSDLMMQVRKRFSLRRNARSAPRDRRHQRRHDRPTKPMDRLICGDVGYGKTEVAMRAAFKAVVDGRKQVAVLVPTTVLAMQHYETFSRADERISRSRRRRLPLPLRQRESKRRSKK